MRTALITATLLLPKLARMTSNSSFSAAASAASPPAAGPAATATGAAADTPHSSSSIFTSSTTSMIGLALSSLSRSSFDIAMSVSSVYVFPESNFWFQVLLGRFLLATRRECARQHRGRLGQGACQLGHRGHHHAEQHRSRLIQRRQIRQLSKIGRRQQLAAS